MGLALVTFITGGLTGGGTALDGVAYAALTDNHFAFVCPSDQALLYRYDTADTNSEDGDQYITPDDNGTGTGNWVKQIFDAVGFGTVPSGVLMRGNYVGGSFVIGTDTDHDIDFGKFKGTDSLNTSKINCAAGTKQIDAGWVIGNNQGGMSPNSTLLADTVYSLHAISGTTGDDFLFMEDGQTIATELAALTGTWTIHRRIGLVRTDSSSNIIDFDYNVTDNIITFTDRLSMEIISATDPPAGISAETRAV